MAAVHRSGNESAGFSKLGALAFVAYVGELAEAQGHHPDIDIRYNKVTLTLSTHEAGGLSEKDFALAKLIDQILG